jgi:hypothetical protein
MLPLQTPVDQQLGVTSRSCSRAVCARRALWLLAGLKRELAELLPTTGQGSNLALLREALLEALGDSQP